MAVIEKYGNVERVINDGSEDNQLTCSQFGYIRHPQDCSKFYRCIKFDQNDENVEKFQYTCPIGLVFDERYEICNWPSWSPTCVGSGEIAHVTRRRFSCPSYGYFQDPENCEYFYYCSDFGKGYFQAYEFKCPFDLAFDEEKLLCNWKWLVKGCGPINPEDQVIKELPQIFNQNTEPQVSGELSNDKFLERSDFLDTDQSNSRLYSHSVNQQRETSKIRKITQYMTKWVEDLGNRFKLLWDSKLESRGDKSEDSWLSHLNQYLPRFQRKRQNVNRQRNNNIRKTPSDQSTKTRLPYQLSDPFISIPIIEIRPEIQNFGHNPNRKRIQSQQKLADNKHPPNRIHFSSDRLQESSRTLSTALPSQLIPDIIPMPLITNKNRNRLEERIPQPFGLPLDYQRVVNHVLKSSTTTSKKTSKRPFFTNLSNSSARNALNKLNIFQKEKKSSKPAFYFPTAQPLVIETLEEIQIPQYLPQQISSQPMPKPKKSNIRDQQQRYLGGINIQKEVLHFSPEELNLDSIKIDTKTPRPKEQLSEVDPKSAKPIIKNHKILTQKPLSQSHVYNVDTKLLESNPLNFLHFSLIGSDSKLGSEIPFGDLQFEEIKTNPKQHNIKPQLSHKQPSDEGQTQILYQISKDLQQPKKTPDFQLQDSGEKSQQQQQQQQQHIQTQYSHEQRPQTPNRQQTIQYNQKQNSQHIQRIPQEKQILRDSQNEHQINWSQKQTQQQIVSQKQPISRKPINSEQDRLKQQYQQQRDKNTHQYLQKETTFQQIPQYSQPLPLELEEETQQETWSQLHKSKTISKPKSIIYWPNIQDFESERSTKKPLSFEAQKPNPYEEQIKLSSHKERTQIPNHSNGNYKHNNLDQFYEINVSNKPKTISIQSSESSQKKVSDHLDASATNNERYASYYPSNQKINYNKIANKVIATQNPLTRNRIISTTKSQNYNKDKNNEFEKSQLLIIPVPEEYRESQKYTNLERLTKDFPNLFSDGLTHNEFASDSGKKKLFLPKPTTARPRIIFSSSPTISSSDEYIMLMLNNDQHLIHDNNGSSTSLHEIFKKTDGKLYNLETDNSKTLVALVPKSNYQITESPLIYESVKPGIINISGTQPPVILKLEIPRPKSDMFQTIVQKVKEELVVSQPLSYQSIFPYNQKTLNNYASYLSPEVEFVTTAKPLLSVTQSTFPFTTTPEIGSKQTIPASIYDSIHEMISPNQWSQQYTRQSESSYTTTSTPISIDSSEPKATTTQNSITLEQIPVYNDGHNVYNYSYPSWHYGMPWYHQLPAYPAVNPYYQPAYAQQINNHTPYSHNQYYPMPSGYVYQPSQSNQPSNSFQPQFLSPNLTSNHWYDYYTTEKTTSDKAVTLSSSTTTVETTTPITTKATTTTHRSIESIRNKERFRPTISRRTTTKKPTTSTIIEDNYTTNQDIVTDKPINLQRIKTGQSEDKPQIQAFAVQGENGPQRVESVRISHQSEKSDQKEDIVRKQVSHYEQNNDKLQNNKEQKHNSQQSNNPFDRYEADMQNIESNYNYKVQGMQ